jgi:hypothetical protein
MFTWILAQWEEYHTSIMLYGNSYYGVLEANYCIAALHIVTFLAGPQLWRTPATAVLPFKFLEGVREWRGGPRFGGGRSGSGAPRRLGPYAAVRAWARARRPRACATHPHARPAQRVPHAPRTPGSPSPRLQSSTPC